MASDLPPPKIATFFSLCLRKHQKGPEPAALPGSILFPLSSLTRLFGTIPCLASLYSSGSGPFLLVSSLLLYSFLSPKVHLLQGLPPQPLCFFSRTQSASSLYNGSPLQARTRTHKHLWINAIYKSSEHCPLIILNAHPGAGLHILKCIDPLMQQIDAAAVGCNSPSVMEAPWP